ncbi:MULTISPECIES: hypothetical protein [Nocardiopsidaceae]|uniref:Uncharacterized protein n=1 Tax=Streptomonospora nanhaiensis TaxID=1323731 RepID=A0ABY6YIH1_9ACTN|nr:hypothetical protein [Streptomonospora nanhaiensis]WAE71994.1 hypothetical protein OUQ99_22570 [Streptomonospora nanhaiensis]
MQNTTAVPILSPVLAPGALRAEAELMAAEAAPRRFAVCAMDYDESDAVVLAWGQAFRDGRVTLVGDAVPVRGTFSSVRSALRVCRALGAPLHVAWVDPEPEG